MIRTVYIFIALLIIFLSGCSKDNKLNINQFSGDWEVTETAKYKEGDSIIYRPGRSYFLLGSYSQGMSIKSDYFTTRFAFGTDTISKTPEVSSEFHRGTVGILDNRAISFTYKGRSQDTTEIADIVEFNDRFLWLRFEENIHTGHIKEYKFTKY